LPLVSTDRTIARLWRDAVAQERAGAAYVVQHDDHWHEVSWVEAAERVENLANGLLARGVGKGEAFATLARTTLDWALFDFALAQVGAVGAPVYASNSPKDVAYVLDHSESVGVLCEDAAQVAKVDEVRSSLPRLQHVLTFDDLRALEAEGAAFKADHPTALDDAVAAIGEDDLFTFIYTSGTTGPPKGCMISHRNYYAMASVIDHLPAYVRRGDLMLLYLPLAHNFGRLMHLTGPYVGYTIAFLPDPLQTAAALTTVRPTVLPSVPRVYEKIHTAIVGALDETTGAKRHLADWSLAVGREVSGRQAAGQPIGSLLGLKHRLADRLVFSKIRDRLGGRLRTPISGGAPLVQEIAEFFDAVGIRIFEGYGLTECTTAATTNTPERWRFGTVGPALPGFELRLAEDGELLIRSDTVFGGYYKDPDATANVLDADGWLRSGDIAEIDADGFVTITDRKKDIIVTAGGKNIAPQNIENDLKASKFISQALVVGDRRPYPAALITLDPVEIGKWASSRGIESQMESLSRDEQVVALVQGIVDEANRDRTRFEQIKRFAILPRDFTMEHDEMTPTLKLKRRVVMQHFADAVEQLYAAP
jgi:long-chain acyl-CoA synthetase